MRHHHKGGDVDAGNDLVAAAIDQLTARRHFLNNHYMKFYVYILFDADAVPRYVGKGHGNRLASTVRTERRNYMKRTFLRETIERLGDVPAVIIRANLNEEEAFIIERAF